MLIVCTHVDKLRFPWLVHVNVLEYCSQFDGQSDLLLPLDFLCSLLYPAISWHDYLGFVRTSWEEEFAYVKFESLLYDIAGLE